MNNYKILLRLGRLSCFIVLSIYFWKHCNAIEYTLFMIIIGLVAFFSELIARVNCLNSSNNI